MDRHNQSTGDEVNPENENLMVDIHSHGYSYATTSFQLNQIHQCQVISIISPYAFTIQLNEHFNASEEFFKNINDYYNSIDDLQIPVEYLRKNLLCVTYDERISVWNRSQILEWNSIDDTVNVFFVDLNSWEENVSRSRLRFILTKYSSRSVYSLTCRLALISSMNNSNQWNDVTSKTFENLVLNRFCDVEPLSKRAGEIFYVNLFIQHEEIYVCMNDFLIHCQMAKPFDDTNIDTIEMLDDEGKSMHAMIALYWKAEGKMDGSHRSSTSENSFQMKQVILDGDIKLIFVKYADSIMFSSIHAELNDENLRNQFGSQSVVFNSHTHGTLYPELFRLTPSTEICFYPINCIRQICRSFEDRIIEILDRVHNDPTFWMKID